MEENNNINENLNNQEDLSEDKLQDELQNIDVTSSIEVSEETQQDTEDINNIVQQSEEPIIEKVSDDSLYEDSIQNENETLITVRPVKFQEFQEESVKFFPKKNLEILQDVSMHISVEIGKANSSIKEIMNLEKGSIVELDKVAGEQVEIYANNKLIARGEVIVIEDKFGVRVTTTNISDNSYS